MYLKTFVRLALLEALSSMGHHGGVAAETLQRLL